MAKVKIIESVEVPSGDPTRIGKKDMWVTYQVDEGRVYMVTIPLEEATDEKIEQEIRRAEEARRKVIGKEFEV